MVVNLNPVLATPINERINRNDAHARQAQWMLQLEREMFAKGMKKDDQNGGSAQASHASASGSVAEFMRNREEIQSAVPANTEVQSAANHLQSPLGEAGLEHRALSTDESGLADISGSAQANMVAGGESPETGAGSETSSSRAGEMQLANDAIVDSANLPSANQFPLSTENETLGFELSAASGLAATMMKPTLQSISLQADQMPISSLNAGEKTGSLSLLGSTGVDLDLAATQETAELAGQFGGEVDFVLDDDAVAKLAYEGKLVGTEYEKSRLHLYHAKDGVHAWIRDAQLSHLNNRQLASNMLSEFAMQGTNLAALSINGKKVLGKAEELFAQPLRFDEELKTGNAHALLGKVAMAMVKDNSHDN